jgi:hypothetical protein
MKEVKISPFSLEALRRASVELNEFRNPLTSETKMKSGYEELFKSCFLNLGMKVDYEPFSLVVGRYINTEITYTPDFVTDLRIRGKLVLIEPHGMKYHSHKQIAAQMIKLKLLRMAYPSMFYLVVASDLEPKTLRFRIMNDPWAIMNEYWETQLPERGTMTRAREDAKIMTSITARLKDLVRRSKD